MFPALATVFLLLAALAPAGKPLSPPPPLGCADQLKAVTVCLLEENNPACCKAFLTALYGEGGAPPCLCSLIREPYFLGFPLTASRVLSLFSSCDGFDAAPSAASLEETCSGSTSPLRNASHDQWYPSLKARWDTGHIMAAAAVTYAVVVAVLFLFCCRRRVDPPPHRPRERKRRSTY